MTRLDQHVSAVRNRLAVALFFQAASLTLLIAAAAVLIGVTINKLSDWIPPAPQWWIVGIVGSAIVAAIVIAIRKRPDRYFAAAAIDQKLGLDEKISTALHMRTSDDAFAAAAVKDAESTAGRVTLQISQHFPITFPKLAYGVVAVALAAWLIALFVTPLDPFGHAEAKRQQAVAQQQEEKSKKQLQDALAVVNAVPPSMATDEKIKLARQDILAQLSKPSTDTAQASRSALKALQDVDAAMQQQIKSNVQYAQAKADEKMWKQTADQPITDAGPVNEIRKELASGKFEQAVSDLSNVVNNFDKMDKKEQQKAAEQMKQLAQQLQQQANPTPAQQQQMQQQLQQLGLNAQQAQQAQQLMQQAATGSPQAQQQLQQMAKQAMSQMNNGQGPTAQQKQQMQQMMQQMQASANSQAQAQQLAQSAKQMAQAMQQQQSGQQQAKAGGQQQANQQSGQQQGAQKQGGQQQGQQASAQQQGGQQQGGQQQGGQQGGQQQSGKQGAGQPQGGQQAGGQQPGMSGAMQQMQQQLQQMQATTADAQQIADAQQMAQDGMSGADSSPPSSPPPQNNRGKGGNGGQPGQGKTGFGSKGTKAESPYTVKQELSRSEDIDTGRLLATNYIKAGSIKGESRAQLKDVAASAIKDPTDEIDQDRISRQAQGVVRKYFNSMQDDATTQP